MAGTVVDAEDRGSGRVTLPRAQSQAPEHPRSRPRGARPEFWRELVFVAVTLGLYTLTRNGLPAQHARARANALDLYNVEKDLRLDIERTLNDFVAGPATNSLSVVA